ncbi:MAG TPA: hypothetical protein VL307_12340 [Chitinophagaceae bacterium]|nr:hypothetical protein [Chitinophagaceae bacterium]
MKTNYITPGRKRLLIFGGFYLATIVLFLAIFSSLGLIGRPPAAASTNDTGASRIDTEFLAADSLLHASLSALQLADALYTTLNDTVSERGRLQAAQVVTEKETVIKRVLDSLEALNAAGANGSMYNVMINSFKTSLLDRRALKNMELTANNGGAAAGNSLASTAMFANKDEQIQLLQQQLKNLQQALAQPTEAAGRYEAHKGELAVLNTSFTDLQNAYDLLNSNYRQLQQEHNTLQASYNALKKLPPAPAINSKNSATNDAAVTALEQQLSTATAELNFAKIDCNLARADAQQIISNARQRKELLTEALGMLRSMEGNTDAAIQKKAKEKIQRLNQVAKTLHD